MTYVFDKGTILSLTYTAPNDTQDMTNEVLMLSETEYLPEVNSEAYRVEDVLQVLDWMEHEAEANDYDLHFEAIKRETYYIAKDEHTDEVYGQESVVCLTKETVEELAVMMWIANKEKPINSYFELFREATPEEVNEYGVA